MAAHFGVFFVNGLIYSLVIKGFIVWKEDAILVPLEIEAGCLCVRLLFVLCVLVVFICLLCVCVCAQGHQHLPMFVFICWMHVCLCDVHMCVWALFYLMKMIKYNRINIFCQRLDFFMYKMALGLGTPHKRDFLHYTGVQGRYLSMCDLRCSAGLFLLSEFRKYTGLLNQSAWYWPHHQVSIGLWKYGC